ncbi:MAG: carboxymuconolactone decarboxylase family protein [Bacteroidales bacterium]
MNHQDNIPRLTPLDTGEMPQEWNEILKRLPGDVLKGDFAPVNVLGTLMYEPLIMGEFLDYWITSKLKMSLSVREQELVILRMAYHYHCNYVWRHHIPVAREFGVSEELLEAVRNHPLPKVFTPREETLLLLTDEMVNHRNVSDEKWILMKNELSDREILDLIHLISQYVLFTLTNNVIRVEVESGLQDISGL